MYIHVIFIELCGLPVLMHIEGFVAKLCILYICIYIYCYIIYDVQLMREATLASWKILHKYRFQWEHHR